MRSILHYPFAELTHFIRNVDVRFYDVTLRNAIACDKSAPAPGISSAYSIENFQFQNRLARIRGRIMPLGFCMLLSVVSNCYRPLGSYSSQCERKLEIAAGDESFTSENMQNILMATMILSAVKKIDLDISTILCFETNGILGIFRSQLIWYMVSLSHKID